MLSLDLFEDLILKLSQGLLQTEWMEKQTLRHLKKKKKKRRKSFLYEQPSLINGFYSNLNMYFLQSISNDVV